MNESYKSLLETLREYIGPEGIHASDLHERLAGDPRIREEYGFIDPSIIPPSLQRALERLNITGEIVLTPFNRVYARPKD